jgi:hypothetical protein
MKIILITVWIAWSLLAYGDLPRVTTATQTEALCDSLWTVLMSTAENDTLANPFEPQTTLEQYLMANTSRLLTLSDELSTRVRTQELAILYLEHTAQTTFDSLQAIIDSLQAD